MELRCKRLLHKSTIKLNKTKLCSLMILKNKILCQLKKNLLHLWHNQIKCNASKRCVFICTTRDDLISNCLIIILASVVRWRFSTEQLTVDDDDGGVYRRWWRMYAQANTFSHKFSKMEGRCSAHTALYCTLVVKVQKARSS